MHYHRLLSLWWIKFLSEVLLISRTGEINHTLNLYLLLNFGTLIRDTAVKRTPNFKVSKWYANSKYSVSRLDFLRAFVVPTPAMFCGTVTYHSASNKEIDLMNNIGTRLKVFGGVPGGGSTAETQCMSGAVDMNYQEKKIAVFNQIHCAHFRSFCVLRCQLYLER